MLSDQLQIKQGPLARVWLASHWERKISKSQFLQTNLEKTIDVIKTNQQEEPITLRVSGQLLLGVVRIYSRKTKYLLEDCNEALVKIKLAFKKGDVNMPDIHHSIANVNTITLQDKLTEFDILLPDLPFHTNLHSTERDPVLDSYNDMSTQDITLSDVQNSFTFGNFEAGRNAQDGLEVGRRDNQAGLADNVIDFDAIADPLKEMQITDGGLLDDGVDFDFDVNDQFDQGPDMGTSEFNMLDNVDTESLMDVGIVEDSQLNFNLEEAEPTVRSRKRLVVDKITEIPADDLRRYTNDSSAIVTKDTQLTTSSTKSKQVVDITRPFGNAVGFELDALFTQLNRKRRASSTMEQLSKEARVDYPFTPGAATTPGAPTPGGLTAFQFDDDFEGGEDIVGGAAYNPNALEDGLMTQNTQIMNSNALQTLEKLSTQFPTQKVVKFGELATSSCKKSEAARLFYDILLLSTKDKIKVKQDRPFGEIQISPVFAS